MMKMFCRKTATGLLAAGLLTAGASQTAAQMPDWNYDQMSCGQLRSQGSGLFIVYPANLVVIGAHSFEINGARHYFLRTNGAPIPYIAGARFFYLPGEKITSGSDAVWSVRTETVEQPSLKDEQRLQANHVMMWRPGIPTSCTEKARSGRLLQFGRWLDTRFVSLREYAQHHPIDANAKTPGGVKIQDRLHLPVDSDCKDSNGVDVTEGNRWDAYGFKKLPNDPVLLATVFGRNDDEVRKKYVGAKKEQRGAYTKEFTIVRGEGIQACFGFSVPDRATFFGFSGAWSPHETTIRIRPVPGRNNKKQLTVTWQAKTN